VWEAVAEAAQDPRNFGFARQRAQNSLGIERTPERALQPPYGEHHIIKFLSP
jgi:hypothetical protein